MTSPSKDDIVLNIKDFLLAQKTEPWMAERLAKKLYRLFGCIAVKVTADFFAKGWDASDLFHWLLNAPTLKKLDPSWASSYEHVFFVEDLLQEAGLSKAAAHSLVLTQAWMFNIPPVTLQFSVETLIRLGYKEDIIKSIANNMPHLFHMLPEHIVHECEFATTNQKGLLWNAFLRRDTATKPEPSHTNPRTGKLRVYVPSKPRPKKANDKKVQAKVAKKPNEIPLPPMELPDPPKEPVVERPKKLKPLRTFNPLHTDPAPKPSEPPEDPEEAPTSIFPGALPMPSIASLPKEDPEDEMDLHSLIDLRKFQAIVEAINPDDEDECWENYLEANPWLKQPKSKEYQACITILRWVPLNFHPTPQSLTDETDAGRRTRFWKAILIEDDIKALLTMPLMVLEIRFYALRRIGSKEGRNFIKEPSWLLREWETSTEAELRYRCNEIEARGKKAHLRPYINMLLEPEREKFLRRLNGFIHRQAHQEKSYLEPDDGLVMDDNPDHIEQDDGRIIMDDTPEPVRLIPKDELRARLLARGKKKAK